MRTDQKLFCLKCSLSIFLIILWILGGAVFGVLLWLRLDFWTNEYLEVDKSLDRYLILIYVSLVDGALILFFSIIGLIGGIKTIKWFLVVYLSALCFAFGLTLAGSVYGFVYREELRNTIAKNDLIQTLVKNRFTGDSMNKFSRAVNIMQSELECCGGEGPVDYIGSNWYAAQPHSRENMAPPSCCNDYHKRETKDCNIWMPFKPGQEKDYNEKIHREGCRTALVHFLESYIVVVVGIVVTAGVLQLICIIIASVLIHVINNLYLPQPDDIVYDMAHNQEKSPYPSRGDCSPYYTTR